MTPDPVIVRLPSDWTIEQIEQYRKHYQELLARHGFAIDPPARPAARPLPNADTVPGWWDRNGKNLVLVLIAWALLSAAAWYLGRRAGIL